MPFIPKHPKLQKNGLYDARELDDYINSWMGLVLLGSLVTITVLTVTTMALAHRLGEEQEKNKK